jgi:uncharacterized DUF497 family protein
MPSAADRMRFEWDDRKAAANAAKHGGVTFLEAATVFTDPLSVIIDDDDHGANEPRFLTIGRSTAGRMLIVSYTERGEVVRIISARRALPREVRAYEEASQ